jgi:hypothetical protein
MILIYLYFFRETILLTLLQITTQILQISPNENNKLLVDIVVEVHFTYTHTHTYTHIKIEKELIIILTLISCFHYSTFLQIIFIIFIILLDFSLF